MFNRFILVLSFITVLVQANCLEEYDKRRLELKHKATLGLAKNTAIATGTTGAFTLGFGYLLWSPGPMAGISYAVGAIGWGVPAFATVIGVESAALINLAKTKKLMAIIEQSYFYEGDEFERFAKKVIKNSDDRLTLQEVGDIIQTSNEDSTLCNASIVSERKQRRFAKTGKIKFKLASLKELSDYIELQ